VVSTGERVHRLFLLSLLSLAANAEETSLERFDATRAESYAAVNFGDLEVSVSFEDKNGDGIEDLSVFRSGVLAAIYFADPHTGKLDMGDFATLDVVADILAVNMVWNDFTIAIRKGDVDSYGAFFSTVTRTENLEVIESMGPFAVNFAEEWSNFRPIEITQDVGSFVITRSEPDGDRDYLIYFVREPGLGWRLHSF